MKNLKNIPFRLSKSSSDNLIVRFSKDTLNEVTSKQSSSFQLEVINNHKLGYASSDQYDESFLIKKATESSQFGDTVSYQYPNISQPKTNPVLFSKKVEKLTAQDFILLGKRLIDEIKQADKNILVDVRLSKSVGNHTIETSNGTIFNQESTGLSIYAEGELVKEGDILNIGEMFSWRDNTFDEKKFTQRLKQKFLNSQKIVPLKSGKYPVLFTPEVLETVLEFLETALSAQSLYKKVSKWQGKLGQKVTDPKFSLIDNPTVDMAFGSTSFDDEGLVAEPLVLIEDGKLVNYFTDLKHAEKLKMTPNGRGFGTPASPSLTNVEITAGETPSEDMLKGLKEGIIIEQIIGGGQDSPYTGDFSFTIHLGFLVKNGEIVGRIKNCMISGNVFDLLLNNLSKISSDREWFGGALLLPHILFEEITISGN